MWYHDLYPTGGILMPTLAVRGCGLGLSGEGVGAGPCCRLVVRLVIQKRGAIYLGGGGEN